MKFYNPDRAFTGQNNVSAFIELESHDMTQFFKQTCMHPKSLFMVQHDYLKKLPQTTFSFPSMSHAISPEQVLSTEQICMTNNRGNGLIVIRFTSRRSQKYQPTPEKILPGKRQTLIYFRDAQFQGGQLLSVPGL